MQPDGKIEPFVLKNKQLLPPEKAPRSWEIYDSERQLWIDANSGAPLVQRANVQGENSLSTTEFGETALTKTREGTDQSESSTVSSFGETVLTRTREETDQAEGLRFSQFGETTLTETREGVDQTEHATDSAEPGVAHWSEDLS